MLLYIALILDTYEKEVIKKHKEENGSTGSNPVMLKDFKYPPVLPIIFYDGSTKWTAETNFLYKTEMHDIFQRYIPKFEYELVDLNKYSVEDLAKYGDLLSLFMIIDKVKKPDELKDVIAAIPTDYLEEINVKVPENLRKLMADVIQVLLAKIDVPQKKIDEVTQDIYERGVPGMFNIENYSVQETRRRAREEERRIQAQRAEQAERRAEQEQRRAEQAEAEIKQAQRRAEQEQRKAEQEQRKAEQEQRRAEQEQRKAEQEQRKAERAEAENEKLRQELAALKAGRATGN
jgi:hypothetical protein